LERSSHIIFVARDVVAKTPCISMTYAVSLVVETEQVEGTEEHEHECVCVGEDVAVVVLVVLLVVELVMEKAPKGLVSL
jgi:hypothetical protein